MLNNYAYTEDVGTITNIQFGIESPERIKQKSVCEIYQHITSQKNFEGTLEDARLGPIEKHIKCPTCHYDYKQCTGHFGHLVLAKPVLQIQYLAILIKILNCVCNRCSSILMNKSDPSVFSALTRRKGKKRFSYVYKNKTKECPNCGATQPKYSRDREGTAKIKSVYPKGDLDQKINPEIILNILKNVTNEDVTLLGFDPRLSRPDWMIWTIMPVPPPAMRPSVRSDSGKVAYDDLTYKLNDIIKFNNQLRIKLNQKTKQKIVEEYWQMLQYHVATYIDNEISSIPKSTHRSGRPLKTLRQRIKSKGGRVRGNLMGKRVNGSGRSVITADPSISIDQLGVPTQIATNLTIPEQVNVYNITRLTQLVRNGPDQYPGARKIHRRGRANPTDLRLFEPEERADIVLRIGDRVHRHLLDNDIVIFNRQPSLHKMSMMAHRVKVLSGKTFRLNVNVTTPYNADFDKISVENRGPEKGTTPSQSTFLEKVYQKI